MSNEFKNCNLLNRDGSTAVAFFFFSISATFHIWKLNYANLY